MAKKISVFRENDAKYFKDYLVDIIREVIHEEETTEPSIEQIASDATSAVGKAVEDLQMGEFDESAVDISGNSVTLSVPTNKGRAELADYIKAVLEKHASGAPVTPVKGSSGFPIGYRIKGSVTVQMKPQKGAGVRNKGDVAEGILGAAVAASFLSGDQEISAAEAEALLEELATQPDTNDSERQTSKAITKRVERDDGTVDEITLDIRLGKVNFDDLMDPRKRGELVSLFKSSAAYANSGEVLAASQAIAVDNNSSKITVLSDGVGDQKGTKVDVRIFMDGKEIPIGKISLKAGSTKQLGQIGKTWDAMAGDRGMFKVMFGVQPDPSLEEEWVKVSTDPDLRNTENIKAVAYKVYADATEKIKSYLAGDNTEQELEFFETLARGVRYQAVLEEQGVRLIQLSKGTFKVLDFDKLEEMLTNIDLDVRLQKESSKGAISPKIIIFDKTSGGSLVSMRVKVEGGGKTIRHYIEKEDGLVELINVAKK
jgi:hypothetical protein